MSRTPRRQFILYGGSTNQVLYEERMTPFEVMGMWEIVQYYEWLQDNWPIWDILERRRQIDRFLDWIETGNFDYRCNISGYSDDVDESSYASSGCVIS